MRKKIEKIILGQKPKRNLDLVKTLARLDNSLLSKREKELLKESERPIKKLFDNRS